jgi:hypothetical protein
MPALRGPGMDHDHYIYSPLPSRPALRWPGGAGLAFCPVLYIEHWELLPVAGTRRVPGSQGHWGNLEPDWRTFTHRDFGNRIGIWRVLDALRARGLRASVALGAAAATRHPEVVAACREAGFEFAAHPAYATRIHASHMSPRISRKARARRSLSRKPASPGWLTGRMTNSPTACVQAPRSCRSRSQPNSTMHSSCGRN